MENKGYTKKNYETRKLDELMTELYMAYAKAVIVGRSCVLISGFKPVQQRVLYAMKEIKAMNGTRRKCARIVGDTMGKYHPHGDSSIYGALCTMVDTNMSINSPWIKGQGNLGVSWSKKEVVAADMRYTEAQLTGLAAEELFRGMEAGSAIMVDNFDKTEIEPLILPVSFPSILVNSTSGIAVGISTDIPYFNLRNVCEATKYLIQNDINGVENDINTFVDTLGVPDYPTGGTLSINRDNLMALGLRGKTKGLYLTGTYSANKETIVIHQIPYNTCVERVVGDIKEAVKDGSLTGVKSVKNTTGQNKMSITIEIIRGNKPEDVMRDIRNLTSFRTSVSYNIGFVNWNEVKNDFEYKECGTFELLEKYWIPWRVSTIRRVYQGKVKKIKEDCHEQEVWEILQGHIKEVVEIIMNNTRADGKQQIMSKYGVDMVQVNHLYSRAVSSLSEDGILDRIDALNTLRVEMRENTKYLEDENLIKSEIIKDLERVAKKYGENRKTNTTSLEAVEHDKLSAKEDLVIEEGRAWVGVTSKGYAKRTMDESESYLFEAKLNEGDTLTYELECENTDTLLVFTTAGFCYKLPVHRIENSRTAFRESIWKLIEKYDHDESDILRVAVAGKYTGNLNILYSNGTGTKVSYKAVSGPRSRYRSLFDPFKLGDTGIIYPYDEFFLVTAQGNAAWIDLTYMSKVLDTSSRDRVTFKLPRLKRGDSIRGFMAKPAIKYFDRIEIDRFKREYCVKMGEDANLILNITYNADKAEEEKAKKLNEEENTASPVIESAVAENNNNSGSIEYDGDEYDEDEIEYTEY